MSTAPTKQMKTGMIGTVLAALCCFTPVLVFGLGAVGLSAWLGWLDYVLFPLMFMSMGLLVHALYLKFGEIGPRPHVLIVGTVIALTAFLFWVEFRFALRLTIAAALSVAIYGYLLRSKHKKRATLMHSTE